MFFVLVGKDVPPISFIVSLYTFPQGRSHQKSMSSSFLGNIPFFLDFSSGLLHSCRAGISLPCYSRTFLDLSSELDPLSWSAPLRKHILQQDRNYSLVPWWWPSLSVSLDPLVQSSPFTTSPLFFSPVLDHINFLLFHLHIFVAPNL